MADYKQMYKELYEKVTIAVKILQQAQAECEAMLGEEDDNTMPFPADADADAVLKNR